MVKSPSEAVYFHARLNPKTSPADKAALKIINERLGKQWNFKDIAVDAIIRSEGIDPAALPSNGLTTASLENVLMQFENRIVERIKAAGGYVPDRIEDEDGAGSGKPTPFAKRFAKSLSSRKDEP